MKLKLFILIFIVIGIFYISPLNKNNIEKYSNWQINSLRNSLRREQNKLRRERNTTRGLRRDKRYLNYKLRYERRVCNREKRRLREIIRSRVRECRNILKNNNKNVSKGLSVLNNKMTSHASRDKVLKNLYKIPDTFKFRRFR